MMEIRPVLVGFSLFLIHLDLYAGNGVWAVVPVKLPTVLIATLVRNKAHTLPYFLSCLDGLNYPKDRISFWIRSDHNEDNSDEIVETWLVEARSKYHNIQWERGDGDEKGTGRPNETSIFDWPEERFRAMMIMKEEALNYARDRWADYVFFLDADAFLVNPESLQLLISQNVTIVAPLLHSDGLYSNYWCGMTDTFYYKRTEEYNEILYKEKVGTFTVPMVHSAVLVHLNTQESDQLTYSREKVPNYSGPEDDIIVFAMSANYSHIPLHVSNVVNFGYILTPIEQTDTMERDLHQLTNTKLLFINEYARPLPLIDSMLQFEVAPSKDRVTVSRIYMINLWRREERRLKMLLNFDAMGLEVDHFPAVDGQLMTEEYLKEMNIQFLPGYADPHSKRPMTMGEIGCFLSHFFIWQRMVEENLEEVLILEDDIKFEPYFKTQLQVVLEEVRKDPHWDLLYLGRKRLQFSEEPEVEGMKYLVRPSYSYWTLGYLISLKGARKLLDAHPLQKLVPVDEYLPIMFDKHTNEDWKKEFESRNLNAFSVAPLFLFPTHYTGEQGYISDTENSVQIPVETVGDGGKVNGSFSEKSGEAEEGLEQQQPVDDRRGENKIRFGESVKQEL